MTGDSRRPQGSVHPAEARTLVRTLQRSLRDARDEQIARALAIVDAMPERGLADALIAPLRPRLTALKPPRPLTFARLLFLPMDPVIVPATSWRRGSLGIPRTALTPLAEQVRREMADEARDIDAAVAGRSVDEQALVLRLGARLWPRASRILASGQPPPDRASDWAASTGLSGQDHATISRVCAAILDAAQTIQEARVAESETGEVDAAALGRIVEGMADRPLEIGMLIAILLTRFPERHDLIVAMGPAGAATRENAGRAAIDKALDFMLDAIEDAGPDTLDLQKAAAESLRVAALLDGLERPGPCHRPSRKTRVETLRRQVDARQRARFGEEMRQRVLAPAEAMGAVAGDREIEDIEAWARDIRQFEIASRRLGSADHYDAALRDAAGVVSRTALPAVDRARLVEIMLGAEAALRLLPAR